MGGAAPPSQEMSAGCIFDRPDFRYADHTCQIWRMHSTSGWADRAIAHLAGLMEPQDTRWKPRERPTAACQGGGTGAGLTDSSLAEAWRSRSRGPPHALGIGPTRVRGRLDSSKGPSSGGPRQHAELWRRMHHRSRDLKIRTAGSLGARQPWYRAALLIQSQQPRGTRPRARLLPAARQSQHATDTRPRFQDPSRGGRSSIGLANHGYYRSTIGSVARAAVSSMLNLLPPNSAGDPNEGSPQMKGRLK
jgi:hypothetical protein